MVHEQMNSSFTYSEWIQMVIFHSYISLPEGNALSLVKVDLFLT
jgi:hypothetical protein